MNPSRDEWLRLEADFRDHVARWLRIEADIQRSMNDHSDAERHDRLADAAELSANAMCQDWTTVFGEYKDVHDIAEEFAERSVRFRKAHRFINTSLRFKKAEIRLSNRVRHSCRTEDDLLALESRIDRAVPESLRLTTCHAFYALYTAWHPDSKIIIADNRSRLLRALTLDESLFRVVSPREFEELVAYAYECLGCRVELTQQSRDFGADVLAWHAGPFDSETLIAVQVKRYASHRKVGIKDIYELHGAVTHYQADSGHVVTSSDYSKPARDFAAENRYHLVNVSDFQRERRGLFGETESGLLIPRNAMA